MNKFYLFLLFQATFLKGSGENPWYYEEHWKVCLSFWLLLYFVFFFMCVDLKFDLTSVSLARL